MLLQPCSRRHASLPARDAQGGYSEPPVEHRARPLPSGPSHGLGAERNRRIFDKLVEAGPGEGKAERKRPGKRREAAAGGAAPPPPVRAAGASGSSARAAGRLTWHSQSRATRWRRRGARSVQSRYRGRGAQDAGRRMGRLGSRRYGGLGVQLGCGASTRHCIATPHQLGSPVPPGNIPRENGNSSVRLRDIIRAERELVPGDSGQGRVCLWNPSALRLDPRPVGAKWLSAMSPACS